MRSERNLKLILLRQEITIVREAVAPIQNHRLGGYLGDSQTIDIALGSVTYAEATVTIPTAAGSNLLLTMLKPEYVSLVLVSKALECQMAVGPSRLWVMFGKYASLFINIRDIHIIAPTEGSTRTRVQSGSPAFVALQQAAATVRANNLARR